MKKQEYIQLLITDNQTAGAKKELYDEVIDCVDIALSKESNDFEVNSKYGLHELFGEIEKKAKAKKCNCVGPFEAAELFAKLLGTSYQRITHKAAKNNGIVNLEDFF